MSDCKFEFYTVEEFFNDYKNWDKVDEVIKINDIEDIKNDKRVVLTFNKKICDSKDNNRCMMIIRFPTYDSYRVRFNPRKKELEHFSKYTNKSIVQDSYEDLCGALKEVLPEESNFYLDIIKEKDRAIITTLDAKNRKIMRMELLYKPYKLIIYKHKDNDRYYKVSEDSESNLYYKKRLSFDTHSGEPTVEYSIIKSKKKPSKAKYFGFGLKGGHELCKNSQQFTYFNYDNMKYSSFYGEGPLNTKEPLYHSDPFFMELNGVPGENSCYGIFIDNHSETLIDVGHLDKDSYMFGSVYGDLDYFFFLGDSSTHIINELTAVIGKTRLIPRFALGYHQGCYGYESKEDLVETVKSYRDYDIPIDGLHVDVDIQKDYCTFTMDEEKFPADTFKYLQFGDYKGKKLGVKCATNITPIISYLNPEYNTFKSGYDNGCFIKDRRCNYGNKDKILIKSDGYYAGGVYYGDDRGTHGHYADFGNKDVRLWWGQQYRFLYDRGLEMVWQDMTTPDIPDAGTYTLNGFDNYIESEHRSFPFDLLLTDNSYKKYEGEVDKDLDDGHNFLAPAGKIRNLYSYNLHKATYHGLNNIWYVQKYSFTSIIDKESNKALHLKDSKNILNLLIDNNIVVDDNVHEGFYVVNKDINLKEELTKSLNDKYKNYKYDILDVLETLKNLELKRRHKRNFIIGRGGFTGMHRFAGLWTGDNASTWEFLKINVAQILSLGLSGQSITGSDVGGFECGDEDEDWADPELLIRWTALGAFLPWFRNHYIRKGKKLFQEPFKYNEYSDQASEDYKYMYKSVLPLSKLYIKARYRLMQIFYDAMFENTITGLPIVRPLFLHSNDKNLFKKYSEFLDNQYLLGKDIMIAPILDKQSTENSFGFREIYLPKDSNWYRYYHDMKALSPNIKGGELINFYAGINESNCQDDSGHNYSILPIYVREGAIIPTVEPESYVGEFLEINGIPSPHTINIYPTKTWSKIHKYTLYNDDGVSRASAPTGDVKLGHDPEAKGLYRQLDITHYYISDEMVERVIKFDRSKHDGFNPSAIYNYNHYYILSIYHDPHMEKVRSISIEGNKIAYKNEVNNNILNSFEYLKNNKDNFWFHDDILNRSVVVLYDKKEIMELRLTYEK